MPYAPQTDYDARLLTQGARDLGAGFQRLKQNQETSASLDAAIEMAAKAHPDALAAIGGPEILDKYSKGGIGQKQAVLGQLTAQVADRYRKMSAENEAARVNIAGQGLANDTNRLGLQEQELNRDLENDAKPLRFEQGPGGLTVMRAPGSKNAIPVGQRQTMLPEPETPWNEEKDATGAVVAKTRWNPYKGETERVDLRQSSGNPLAALLGGAAGMPQGGANSPGGTGGPQNNALLPSKTPAPTSYGSADAVRAAVKAGSLSREQAVEILRKQFGMK